MRSGFCDDDAAVVAVDVFVGVGLVAPPRWVRGVVLGV